MRGSRSSMWSRPLRRVANHPGADAHRRKTPALSNFRFQIEGALKLASSPIVLTITKVVGTPESHIASADSARNRACSARLSPWPLCRVTWSRTNDDSSCFRQGGRRRGQSSGRGRAPAGSGRPIERLGPKSAFSFPLFVFAFQEKSYASESLVGPRPERSPHWVRFLLATRPRLPVKLRSLPQKHP